VNKEKSRLLTIIDSFPGKKVAVWGDFILDEYLYGTTRRISREAPVLILSYRDHEYLLGGAGNSLLNLKALGADPIPIGVLGQDTAGRRITGLIRKKKISPEYLLTEKAFSTPMKTRILAGEENTRKQQILRIDKEAEVPDTSALNKRIFKALKEAEKQANALIISDYNYLNVKEDIYTQILPEFKRRGIPIALDSRFRLLQFKGTTVATPNEPEVEAALQVDIHGQHDQIQEIGRKLLKATASQAVLLTRGSQGMVLFQKGKPLVSIPVFGSTHIVDVTGAGDTVITVFTLALAVGAGFKDAARLANYAGGLVVMKKGTATVSPQELKEAIVSEP
jgi:rfaE bifunctional protein kinase chain/domain